MRCRDVEALDSAYLDGELDDARASAVRGHLRVCQACSERVADLATLISAASRLEPVEPGPSLWAGIERGLAEAEIADSRRSWLWLRWQSVRPRLLPATVALAAAALLVVWTARRGHEPGPARTQAMAGQVAGQDDGQDHGPGEASTSGQPRHATAESFSQVMSRDVAEADQRYVTAIAELRALVDEERADWPEAVRAAYDARLGEFEAAARGHAQMMVAAPAQDARARDALYAVYRAEIEFLQRAALQGPGLVAAVDRSAGGRP